MPRQIGFFRRWAIQQSPISAPETAEIQIPDTLMTLPDRSALGQIDLPLLVQPEIEQHCFTTIGSPLLSLDLANIPVEIVRIKATIVQLGMGVHDEDFVHLDSPESIILRTQALDQYPEILDLFTGLTRPGGAGKSYGKTASHQQSTLLEAEVFHANAPKRPNERCIHGISKNECAICYERKTAKPQNKTSQKKVRTLDVFDLLLPYLQPPIEYFLAQPVLFPTERRPFDYQITGIKFLAERKAALLGDEMGLGKTIQTIVALQVLYRRGAVRQTLILCPRSLLGTWERELNKWSPELYILRVRGTQGERSILWQSNSSVYLTTYETLRQDIQEHPHLCNKFQIIILDEIQKIKNSTTETARSVRRIKAEYRWGLSGTPLENRLEDVISIYTYLVPGLFQFNEFLTPQVVKTRIDPYFLRRRTADVRQELPEKQSEEIWLELTENQRSAYLLAEEKVKSRLGEPNTTRVHIFALITELKKICNLAPETGESCKLDYLMEQLESIVDNEQKALVFSHLPTVTLAKIESKLRPFHPAIFDGSLSDRQRELLIDNFQKQPHPSVLLMSIQAGGVGLTLTAANHVFHFDHWWNPAVARQAEARSHRIGQQRTVFVHDLYTTDTIEERIYHLLQKKQALFNAVIDDLSADYVQGAITDEELFALFDLKPPSDLNERSRFGYGQSVQKGLSATQSQGPNPNNNPAQRQKKLDDLSPTEFESFVAVLYTKMGYKASVTPQSRDHGIDVIAKRQTAMGVEEIIVQCKHYPQGSVGEPEVRNLLGAWQEYRSAQIAVLITSGRFSADALTFATKHRIKLIDRQELLQLYHKTR